MFTSVMLWWGITDTSSLQPQIHKEPNRGSRGGRGQTSTEGIEGHILTLSQFTVLGGCLCSLCLSGNFFFSLSSSLVASHSTCGKMKICWCLHKHNDLRPCLFLNQQKKRQKRQRMDRGRDVWRIVKRTQGILLCHWWHIPWWQTFFRAIQILLHGWWMRNKWNIITVLSMFQPQTKSSIL